MKIIKIARLFIFLIFMPLTVLFAYDDEVTHRKLTEKAIGFANIEDYIISSLSFTVGLNTVFPFGSASTIKYWLTEGSKLEDTPLCRATNHFFNPKAIGDVVAPVA